MNNKSQNTKIPNNRDDSKSNYPIQNNSKEIGEYDKILDLVIEIYRL